MTGREIECVVWCAHCEKDKFRVVREPTGQNGVYHHKISWAGMESHNTKTCPDCAGQLSRKEDHG